MTNLFLAKSGVLTTFRKTLFIYPDHSFEAIVMSFDVVNVLGGLSIPANLQS
jgi:hypothetical protein